jgi:hypothetical protein
MEDLQQDPNKTENQAPNPTGADNAKAQAAIDKQQADKAAAVNRANQAGPGLAPQVRIGAPTSVEVAGNSEAIQEHIQQAKSEFADLDKAVQDSPAAEHGGIPGLLARMRDRLENLTRHAAHNAKVANAVPATATQTAPIGGLTAAAPVSTASSDAHLNRGNGGAVTGNRSTAPAPEVAVQ